MPAIALLVPGSLDAISGGSIYDKRIASGLRDRGWTVDVRELPSPAGADDVLSALEPGSTAVVDGLIFGAIPEIAERHGQRVRLVPVVHLPLAQEPGLQTASRQIKEEGERRALAHAALVVVTGRGTRDTMVRYGVPRDRIAIVEPGTDPAPVAVGSGSSTLHLLCVATFNAGKAHDVLLRALAAGQSHDWRLTCVGSTERDPNAVATVRALIRSFGLENRVVLTGELIGDALAAAYATADAFVLATRFETYGMAVADALARGLPVVSTSTGAIPSLVGDDAGLLVAPGDEQAMADALSRFLEDPRLRSNLRAGALRARMRLRTWDAAVDEMTAALTNP